MVNYQLVFSPALDRERQNKMVIYLIGEEFRDATLMETGRDDVCSTFRCHLYPELEDEHIEYLRGEFNLTDYDIIDDDVTEQFSRLKSLIEKEEP